ncbi:MAG: sensor histidine kinase [Rickettsiales bacterium]
MFGNLKNIAVILFIVLVILTLISGVFFKYTFVDNIVRNASDAQAEVLTETYVKNIWNRYYPVITFLSKRPVNEWDLYSQFKNFQAESADFFKSKGVIKVVITNSSGLVVFDSAIDTTITEKTSIFKSMFGKGSLNEAKKVSAAGAEASVVILGAEVKTPAGMKKLSVLDALIPIAVTQVRPGTEDDAKDANAIVELVFDVDDTVNKLDSIQFALIFLIIAALSILTGAVLYSAHTAEVVVEKQQEIGLEMAAAKAAAEAENKSKSQFLANVSHELRTPLNAIIGFSEIINSESMGPIGNEQYKEFVKDIHTSGVHLLGLINDILDFSKSEENKLSVDSEPVDVTKLVKVCLRMVMPRAEESKVKLVEEVPNEHLILKADPKRLKQVILNLLSNAVKFTTEGGSVTVKVWNDNDTNSVIFEVRDTGVGMAPQDLARALSPFGQVDNKLSRRYEGTGLGLPLTKKLIELMKGRFDIISEVGLGTTVTITFPIQSNDIEDTSTIHTPTSMQHA